ncbi:cupin domain-containing protein [Methylomonas sp. LW13]|uniref:cupin domain-containing protein n=1 Tax=unclassified Methylomonas TaxID=2608980 RepID=UPI00051C9592|nr:cupin domain-containing protein [Methylomonas sp. LW13]QBC29918.1 cupin domain-containing protein [Methylomonas sp. LW13]
MQAIDRSSAEHYTWGNGCDGWHLVKRADMSVISERVPPGASEVRHFHASARQFFYILEGCAILEINGKRIPLSEGQGIEVDPGTPHQFLNESSADVRFLVISHPATLGDRLEV